MIHATKKISRTIPRSPIGVLQDVLPSLLTDQLRLVLVDLSLLDGLLGGSAVHLLGAQLRCVLRLDCLDVRVVLLAHHAPRFLVGACRQAGVSSLPASTVAPANSV